MPRRWVVFAFATVLFSVMPAVSATAAGPTYVTSHISTNTTWTRTGEPYIVNIATLWVQPGVTLTIQPGVRVVMNQSLGVLDVKGNLQALGTKARPIVFTSGQDYYSGGTGAGKGQWWNISFTDAGTGRLDHVEIKYGGYLRSDFAPYAYTVLKMESALDVWVTNSTIHDNNNSGVLATANVPIHISNTKIYNNDVGVSVVGTSNGVAQIDHSTLSNNSVWGLFVNHGGTPIMQSVITDSNITANGQAVQLNEYATVPTERYPTGHDNNIWDNSGNIEQLSILYPRPFPAEHLWDNNYWGENILADPFPCPFAISTAWPFHLVDTSDLQGLPNRGPIQSTEYSNPESTSQKCRADDIAVHNAITDPIRTGAPA